MTERQDNFNPKYPTLVGTNFIVENFIVAFIMIVVIE